MRFLLGVAAIMGLGPAAFVYAVWRAQRPADRAPNHFVRDPQKKTVACLGASLIHGRISYGVVDMLVDRLGPEYQVINAGVNGDLAYNLRRRLPEIVACRPDVAIILVGTNDGIASLSRRSEARYRRMKGLPQRPTREWYRENLRAVVSSLKSETRAAIAVCSLPVLGEALDSPPNRRITAFTSTGAAPRFWQTASRSSSDARRSVRRESSTAQPEYS